MGVFLVWYSIGRISPEEREKLLQTIVKAKPIWVAISILLGILSHMSRAYRWSFLLEPLGYKTSYLNRFMSLMAGYLANVVIIRSGELLRGATLANYEDAPTDKIFGTIVAERIVDLFMLLMVVSVALFLQSELFLEYLKENKINPLWTLGGVVAVIGGGILFLRLIANATHPVLIRIRNFGTGLLEGAKSILYIDKKVAYLAHTLFIWFSYILMFYVIKFALPGTEDLSFGAILVAFVAGSFAMTTTNGGIGLFPIAIGVVLSWYSIDQSYGEAYGWVIWTCQTSLVLIIGALSFIYLPIWNKEK